MPLGLLVLFWSFAACSIMEAIALGSDVVHFSVILTASGSSLGFGGVVGKQYYLLQGHQHPDRKLNLRINRSY
jgi:hypothetical protein